MVFDQAKISVIKEETERFINKEYTKSLGDTFVRPLELEARNKIYMPAGGSFSFDWGFGYQATCTPHSDDPIEHSATIGDQFLVETYRDSQALIFFLGTKFTHNAYDTIFSKSVPRGIGRIPLGMTAELWALALMDLTLGFLFHHELAHLRQRHYIIWDKHANGISPLSEYGEIDSETSMPADRAVDHNITEFAADFEAAYRMVDYIEAHYNPSERFAAIHALACGTALTFCRFFSSRGVFQENEELKKHPNPGYRMLVFMDSIIAVAGKRHSSKFLTSREYLCVNGLARESMLASARFWQERMLKDEWELPNIVKTSGEPTSASIAYFQRIRERLTALRPIMLRNQITPDDHLVFEFSPKLESRLSLPKRRRV